MTKKCKLILKKYNNRNIKIVIQKEINGMATAIQLALKKTKTKNFFLTLGRSIRIKHKNNENFYRFFEKINFL